MFDRMLKSGMKETHDRTVEIEDATMETVATMVYYMYTVHWQGQDVQQSETPS